ncbi:TatD DNase family protein [Parabacteroides sp. PF5-5]|uniref:TatD family hydrolase n=1 Tax=unclassified Parabacteroides TaxID=2649774 RepID=UPI002474E2BB|nr:MULTISPECIES: TatD family hydrolase [unclassified Parabacteroides]MDH6305010.1 TatD DNase family protein [Parabacteroides sp. PH5-39]MDH6315905.1 TatD DNase family protein [Parabacteroides sp. PF5-13]MDH6319562.1 TatD DNase family protein [Parabacteroides sp. PH5-13]MDH6323293.1 TatD DNase family protein [Parabacteroides sp. PH5-8]MDH6327199.1 TatD DNase family protein [Parabacteroides sp. PH5-41]
MTAYCDIHTHQLSAHPDCIAIVNRIIKEGRNEEWKQEPISPPFLSLGIHPWYITNVSEQLGYLKKEIANPKVVAIGEAGLDKLADTSFDVQLSVFTSQAQLAEDMRKPLIVHCVKAWTELLAVRKQINPKSPWIIHGFRGNKELSRQLINHGLYLSFGKYCNPEALREVWRDRIFAETDDIDVDIRTIYKQIASSLDVTAEEVVSQIRKNVEDVFGV